MNGKRNLTIVMLCIVSFCFADNSDTLRAKQALFFAQQQLNQATTYKMIFRDEARGQIIVNTVLLKKHNADKISCRHEMKFLSGKTTAPPVLVRLVDRNKIYILPVGVGSVAVRLKFEEMKKINLMANFFLEGGDVKMLEDTQLHFNIRYTCSASERQAMLKQIPQEQRAQVYDFIPSIYQYKIDKKNGMLKELLCFTSRGKLVKRILFDEITLNCELEESLFHVPKRYKLLVANTAKDLSRIQKALVKRIGKPYK